MSKSNTAQICLLAGSFLVAAATIASAIECEEDYQIVQGQPISTPYDIRVQTASEEVLPSPHDAR